MLLWNLSYCKIDNLIKNYVILFPVNGSCSYTQIEQQCSSRFWIKYCFGLKKICDIKLMKKLWASSNSVPVSCNYGWSPYTKRSMQRYSDATMLRCINAAMQRCHNTEKLQCNDATTQKCCSATYPTMKGKRGTQKGEHERRYTNKSDKPKTSLKGRGRATGIVKMRHMAFYLSWHQFQMKCADSLL